MKYLTLILLFFILIGCSSSSIEEKYAQINKTMTKAQVIEIMGQPTATETRERIECLTRDINTPKQLAYYGIFIDLDKNQVLDAFSTREPIEDSKIERWQRYLAGKIDKIISN